MCSRANPKCGVKTVSGLGAFSGLKKNTSVRKDAQAEFRRLSKSVRKVDGSKRTALQAASFMEIAQIAEADPGVVFGTAAISAACVMIGIAIGFVLLRVESLVEDGTIDL